MSAAGVFGKGLLELFHYRSAGQVRRLQHVLDGFDLRLRDVRIGERNRGKVHARALRRATTMPVARAGSDVMRQQ